jgi:hypothetical protein
MDADSLSKLGFYFGTSGAHAGRSLMLADLDILIRHAPAVSLNEWFSSAILNENLLAKTSFNNRIVANKRMRQLYGLDARICLYRNFRNLYLAEPSSQPAICTLMAMARDGLFRKSVDVILRTQTGLPIASKDFREALDSASAGRMSEETMKHACNNVFNSWTQAGFLSTDSPRVRTKSQVGWGAVAFALFLGWLEGERGRLLFDTQWAKVLDRDFDELLRLATLASRQGHIELLNAGGVIEVRFPGYLTTEEQQLP